MTHDGTDPDTLPNGEGHGSTSDNAGDTTSGGAPSQPDTAGDSAPDKEDPDGTPVENPAG